MARAERSLPLAARGETTLRLRVDEVCPGAEFCVWLKDDMGGYSAGMVFDGEGRVHAYSAGRTEYWSRAAVSYS